MLARILSAAAIVLAFAAGARAQTPSSAQLLQDWVCPSGSDCQTSCAGPGGNLSFAAHDVKVFQFSVHVRRLWLDADGQIYVLGDDDRCHFGGATSTPIQFVTQPPPVSSLGPPVPPQCTCIGTQCNPPGCASPLR